MGIRVLFPYDQIEHPRQPTLCESRTLADRGHYDDNHRLSTKASSASETPDAAVVPDGGRRGRGHLVLEIPPRWSIRGHDLFVGHPPAQRLGPRNCVRADRGVPNAPGRAGC